VFKTEDEFAREWRRFINELATKIYELEGRAPEVKAETIRDLIRLTKNIEAKTFIWAAGLVKKELKDLDATELFSEARFRKIARQVQEMLRKDFTQLTGAAKETIEKAVKANAAETKMAKRLIRELPSEVKINGRLYDRDWYAKLVAQSAKGEVAKATTLTIVGRMGDDLVQVSDTPSIIGDFCDAYRGKVFSVSGTHPDFPPLARTPNTGPPFHPFCYHGISWYRGPERAEMGRVDERFLLQGAGDSFSKIQKRWKEAHGEPQRKAA